MYIIVMLCFIPWMEFLVHMEYYTTQYILVQIGRIVLLILNISHR